MKNPFYTSEHSDRYWNATMPKKPQVAGFGERLVKLRKEAGFTQQELGDEIGVSRRMIAYYESQSAHPPTHMLPAMARALDLTTDELLGVKAPKKKKPAQDTRLQRRMQQIEKLPAKERRQLIQLIDTFLEAARYRKSA